MSAADAKANVRKEHDHVVAELNGEIDLSNSRELEDRLASALTNETLGLVVDLTAVRYLDSAGVSTLFALARQLETRRQKLVLVVGDRSPMRRLLEITRADMAADVASSLEEAAEALRTGAADPLGP